MNRDKVFIIKEIGTADGKPYAAVRPGEAWVKWFGRETKRKVLFVEEWFATEDEARLYRDRANKPDFD